MNKDGDSLKLKHNVLIAEINHHGSYTTVDSETGLSYLATDLVHEAIEKANKWDLMMNFIGNNIK